MMDDERAAIHGNERESEERASLNALVERMVGAAYETANVLGAGFLGKVYERGPLKELTLPAVRAAAQVRLPFSYKDSTSGSTRGPRSGRWKSNVWSASPTSGWPSVHAFAVRHVRGRLRTPAAEPAV